MTTVMSLRRLRPLPAIRRYTGSSPQAASVADSPDKLHGSQHWLFERLLSVTSLGLVGTAMALPVSAPTGLLNLALGTIIPLHCHFGFGAVITDYLPRRKFPWIYPMARVLLWTGTSLTLYGLYRFNTEDVGIIEGIRTLWHCKSRSRPEDESE